MNSYPVKTMEGKTNLANEERGWVDGRSNCSSWTTSHPSENLLEILKEDSAELKEGGKFEEDVSELEEGFNECLKLEDPISGTYKLKIEGWSKISLSAIWSKMFTVGDQRWFLHIYPKASTRSNKGFFVDISVDKTTLPSDKSVYAEFLIKLRDQLHGNDMCFTNVHRFSFDAPCSGFLCDLPPEEMNSPSRGVIVSDTCIFEANVTVRGYSTLYDVKD